MKFLLPLLMVLSINANAVPMAPINVAGTDWLQPIDFVGLSWGNIAAVCDPVTGVCNGSLNGNDMAGWVWASVSDVNQLFNHYIGYPALGSGPDLWVGDISFGQSFFADGWAPTYVTDPGYIGETATIGFMANSTRTHGVLSTSSDLSLTATRTDLSWSGTGPNNVGGWFKRGTIPLPATAPLITIALIGLCWFRRKPSISRGVEKRSGRTY